MTGPGWDKPLKDAITGADAGDSRAWFEQQLSQHRQHLRELPHTCAPADRARLELEIAEFLMRLNRVNEAWEIARRVFDVFVEHVLWQDAVEACEILYLADREDSIVALGNGVWLAVTFPIEPEVSVRMLHHIVDETPDQSDGAAVAAMAAHYIVDLRANDSRHESLTFTTSQMVARVAKRHRGMDDEQGINIWIEMLELNRPKTLLSRLGRMLDVIVEDRWWIDRDALRAKLPVN